MELKIGNGVVILGCGMSISMFGAYAVSCGYNGVVITTCISAVTLMVGWLFGRRKLATDVEWRRTV